MCCKSLSQASEYEQTNVYRPWMLVDVRDDAECHIRLLESVQVQNGERYIAWSTDLPPIVVPVVKLVPGASGLPTGRGGAV